MLAAGNRGGGAGKGAAELYAIELKRKVLEHTWRSRSSMEVTAMLERDRRSTATTSSGGAGGASVEGSLEGKPATPGHPRSLSTPQGCSQSKESMGETLTGAGEDERRSRPRPRNFKNSAGTCGHEPNQVSVKLNQGKRKLQEQELEEGRLWCTAFTASSTLGNGGSGDWGAVGSLEHGGCQRELEGEIGRASCRERV